MTHLSKREESLLSEILKNTDENNNCDLNYWENRFSGLNFVEDCALRSSFAQLKNEGMIDVFWADDIPANIVVLAKGISYSKERDFYKEKDVIMNNYVNNFYGDASEIQIQQGNVGTQIQNNNKDINVSKVNSIIQTLNKYDSVLDAEYGAETANDIRKHKKELIMEMDTTKDKSRIRDILIYLRDVSVNVAGGVIASAIYQLIANALR